MHLSTVVFPESIRVSGCFLLFQKHEIPEAGVAESVADLLPSSDAVNETVIENSLSSMLVELR
ncbi:MAG: hypothetical protein LZF86_40003 [Nitrospira sp.]|nr:MAG: hypothetical protein LZF86_40003 [Nitrospira sp.]